jgi:hypothetical protein
VEYVPAPQLVHRAAPAAGEYVPAPQSVHAADPVDALHLPATHAVHGPPVGPENPVLQMLQLTLPAGEEEFDGQAMHAEAPTAVEYVPAPQSVHAADPVDAVYFPATHPVHVPPAGPINPALQVQLAKAELPAGELEFDGHAKQVDTDEAPAVVEYVPAKQSMLRVDPAVKSWPHTMASTIAEVVSALRYSSSTYTPAMSPLK